MGTHSEFECYAPKAEEMIFRGVATHPAKRLFPMDALLSLLSLLLLLPESSELSPSSAGGGGGGASIASHCVVLLGPFRVPITSWRCVQALSDHVPFTPGTKPNFLIVCVLLTRTRRSGLHMGILEGWTNHHSA